MDTRYDHWSIRLVMMFFGGFTGIYAVIYYLPHLIAASTTFPLLTHLMVPAVLAIVLTYCFGCRRIGHHMMVFVLTLLLGVTFGKSDGPAAVFYIAFLAALMLPILFAGPASRVSGRPRLSL